MKSGESFRAHITEYRKVVSHFVPSDELTKLRSEIPDKKDPHYSEKKYQLVTEAMRAISEIAPKVRQLIPSVLDAETLSQAHEVERFWYPRQARDERKHNREHLTMVGVMASVLTAELTVDMLDAQQLVTASVVSGYLHDIMRFGDKVSSFINLKHHGFSIAKRLPKDLQRLVENGSITQAELDMYVPRMQKVLRYHDVPHLAPQEVRDDPLFKALYLADSLAMLRYLTDRKIGGRAKTAIQNISEHALERKLYDVEVNTDPQLAALRDRYLPVMGALLLLSDEFVGKRRKELEEQYKKAEGTPEGEAIGQRLKNKEYQVTGVLDALSELGLWGESSATASVRRGAHRSE